MEQVRKYPTTVYYWYVPCPINGKVRRTRYRMSETEAIRYPGATRDPLDQGLVISGPNEERPNKL